MESPKPIDLKVEIEKLAYYKWLYSGSEVAYSDSWFWYIAEAEVLAKFKPVKEKEIHFKPLEVINNEVS